LINAHLGWRWAFYLVMPPGLLLGFLCFTQRDPRALRGTAQQKRRASFRNYITFFRTPSYVLNTFAQTAMTFAIAGLGFWVAAYLRFRGQPESGKMIFGAITVVAGLAATLLGGVVADRLRPRIPGSYFLVSAVGMLAAFPLFAASLYVPFPAAWWLMAAAIFFAFLNTGPSNTALANVTLPSVRASAFALNILIIHTLGDAIAFPAIGYIAGHSNMTIAFLVVSGMMLIAGLLWLAGMKHLAADTAAVEASPEARV
jgi:predicted MFS family arabinose efflux permease